VQGFFYYCKKYCQHYVHIDENERVEFMWQCENIVKIRTREQFRLPVIEPFFFYEGLAFWAMPIPAGVVCILLCTTMITHFDMAAKGSGKTHFNMPHCLELLRRENIFFSILLAISAKDICYLWLRFIVYHHSRPPFPIREDQEDL